MRQLVLMTIALLYFASAGATNTNACSCGGTGGPCESYGRAAAVFVGTVIDYRENKLSVEAARRQVDWQPRVFKFAVEQAYSGVDTAHVEVATGVGGGDCGYDFKNGQRYLVYAYQSERRLATNICTRTKPFVEANEDLAFLGNLSTAPRGSTIQGLVTRAPEKEKPLPFGPDVTLTLEGDNDKQDLQLDERGRYRVTGVRPGKYKLRLNLPDTLTVYQPEQEITVADRGCAGVIFSVSENGRVSGRVLDIEGQPVPRIHISLVAESTADLTNSVSLERTDDEGRYSFSGVRAGRYVIAINYARFPDPNDPTIAYSRVFYPGVLERAHAQVITLTSGGKITDRDILLPVRRPLSVIEGQVLSADGVPVTKPFVSARDVTYESAGMNYGITVDAQGRFKINGYVGQKLLIEARTETRLERLEILLSEPVHKVNIRLRSR